MEKIPCEVIVWYVLPVIRRRIVIELLSKENMTQARAAKLVGVTPSAVSQYLKDKRGSDIERIIPDRKMRERLAQEFEVSASAVLEGESAVSEQICRVCTVIRNLGLLHYFHNEDITVVDCMECQNCPE